MKETNPVAKRPPRNKSERKLFAEMSKDGWELTKQGFPDFACFRGDEFILVEVKPNHNHKLKKIQYRVLLALAERGIKCYRWDPDKGFELVTAATEYVDHTYAQGKRTWIKLYPLECLEGSIRYQLEADERGVWYDLLNFAALCSTSGSISDHDGRPYPHSFIANRLNITLELLERTLTKCFDEGRLIENEHGLHLTNWSHYQSEYERQKQYRQGTVKV